MSRRGQQRTRTRAEAGEREAAGTGSSVRSHRRATDAELDIVPVTIAKLRDLGRLGAEVHAQIFVTGKVKFEIGSCRVLDFAHP
jgi:hypothetical protein